MDDQRRLPTVATSYPTTGNGDSITASEPLVVPFSAVDRTALALVGGKGANLGEMTKVGFPVPPGFCITTHAYTKAVAGANLAPTLAALDRASELGSDDLLRLAGEARSALLAVPIPADVEQAVRAAYATLCGAGDPVPVAVRSSATAEDLPEASFAGQQDTYLNIIGADALIDAMRRCWASLWTDRAVSYRTVNSIDHRVVKLSVVVQQLVVAEISGVLFTANPLTNRRREAVIDATPGLGEALVSGAINPDHFVVDLRTRAIIDRRLTDQHMAILPRAEGGIEHVALPHGLAGRPRLTARQAVEIAELGSRVETHYGVPQDIEWAIDGHGKLWLLQARPITTLFPTIDVAQDRPEPLRVFFSFNMAQGVLQPLTPMGIEMFRKIATGGAGLLGIPVDPQRGPSAVGVAADRMFLDLTTPLRTRLGRRLILGALQFAEPRTGEALRSVMDDPRLAPPPRRSILQDIRQLVRIIARLGLPPRIVRVFLRPDQRRNSANEHMQAFLDEAARPAHSPAEALDRAEQLALQFLPRAINQIFPVLLTAMGSFALASLLARATGMAEAVPLITRGLPHNVTTEMNMALWRLSQRLRADPAAAAALHETPAAELAAQFLAGNLPPLLQREVGHFLARYGVRGVAEIDIGVARWNDDPTAVFSSLSNYLRLRDPEMAPDIQFRKAEAEANDAMRRIVARAKRTGALGRLRALALSMLFRRARALMGFRESPKFYVVSTIGRCRALLLEVGAALVREGKLANADDIFFLTFVEARSALAGTNQRELASKRRASYDREMRRRKIPRLLLSDGTALYGAAPSATSADGKGLVGSPASPGVYVGVACVVLDPNHAHITPGDILVAPSTDPGWTPLFMTAGALVMEMGGMMSHGAVVAREYGIPAVVGVPGATTAIRSGQRIKVDGERGTVTLITPTSPHDPLSLDQEPGTG